MEPRTHRSEYASRVGQRAGDPHSNRSILVCHSFSGIPGGGRAKSLGGDRGTDRRIYSPEAENSTGPYSGSIKRTLYQAGRSSAPLPAWLAAKADCFPGAVGEVF